MDFKYKKVKLDDKFSKFTINDDCTIVSDSESITKLYDYFSVLYNGLTNALILDKGTMEGAIYHMQEANKILKSIPMQKEENHISVKDMKNKSTFDLINQNIVWDDPFGRLIPEEALCVVLSYGDEVHLRNAPQVKRNMNFAYLREWFKLIFPDMYSDKKVTGGYVLSVPAKLIDPTIAYKYNLSSFAKSKRFIDTAGGLSCLFNSAASDVRLMDVSKELGVPPIGIVKYLNLYGFNGWKDWTKFVYENNKNWKTCATKIIKTI